MTVMELIDFLEDMPDDANVVAVNENANVVFTISQVKRGSIVGRNEVELCE